MKYQTTLYSKLLHNHTAISLNFKIKLISNNIVLIDEIKTEIVMFNNSFNKVRNHVIKLLFWQERMSKDLYQ